MTNARAPQEPQIVARTDEFAVLEKPAGLLVHRAESSPVESTLADWVVAQFPSARGVGDEPAVRPGIVHRLDREASGLLVVALTQESFENLKRQFAERTTQKEYLVLVHGRMVRDHGDVKLPISRAAHGGRMAAHASGSDIEDVREAHTEFSVERRFTNATLLRVRIHSGRTHQIRVHMFALGHAVVGDPLYRPKKIGKAFPQPPRLFLHAARLAFSDSAGERHDFVSALPSDLAQFLLQLKSVV